MEIDRVGFAPRLLEILTALSEAHFVSFDLELSGVASKSTSHRGKQTLQERYSDVKEAAQRYQILQIGLTCAYQDKERDTYVLRPYNFNLNPLLQEKLGIERVFSFQGSAVEFLISHGFQLQQPFLAGVPYLSRDEAALAKKVAYDRLDKTQFEDLQLNSEDVQSLEFVKRVRQDITDWKTTGKPYPDFLNIVPSNLDPNAGIFPELSRFEKRLVHQLVRAEYPDLVTISRPQTIKIVRFDEARENEIRRQRKQRVKQQINKQTGFRWIVEAMTGADIHRLDLKSFAFDPVTGEAKFVDLDDLSARFNRAKILLKKRQPVLVGHNLFTDLVYFYKCFIGQLPDTVEEFQLKVHELFPVIVDTKYMATHNCGDINPASSLEQIEEKLRMRNVPSIETHHDHPKYLLGEHFHEAGYDSYLTARIMILLSAKLEAEGTYVEETKQPQPIPDDETYLTPPEEGGGVSLRQSTPSPTPDVQSSSSLVTATNGTTTLFATCEPAEPEVGKKKRKKANKDNKSPANTTSIPTSRFSHATMFERLRNLDLTSETLDDDVDTLVDEQTPITAVSTSRTLTPNGVVLGATPEFKRQPPPIEPTKLMPPFETDFWHVYGNKLRVFGTVENVCRLAGQGM